MEVKIKYPEIKCAYCGKPFTRKHNRQKYCSTECSTNAERENRRKRDYRYYHRHKTRINQTRKGTRSIGPKPNPNPEREAEIIQNEIERIGLNFLNRRTLI